MKTLAIIFAMLFVAVALIGCSTKTETTVIPGTNNVVGDATGLSGLDNAFDIQPVQQVDPTADLPTANDIANAGQ